MLILRTVFKAVLSRLKYAKFGLEIDSLNFRVHFLSHEGEKN